MSWISIKELSATAIELAPVPHVFGPWDMVYLAWKCRVCGTQLITEKFMTIGEHCDETQIVDHPSINRLFPLPDPQPAQDRARALADLPIALVHMPENNLWGLALTVPIMSRWELVEAYMRLSYLPPFSIIEHGLGMDALKLPSRINLWIMAGAAETARVMGHRTRETGALLEQERQGLVDRRVRR